MISTYQSPTRSKPTSTFKAKGRVLIACEDSQAADELVAILKKANLRPEWAKDFTSACKLLKTGKFHVVFATPRVSGDSWQKLMDFARGRGQALSFVIVARSFDLSDWASCLKYGAFEVLDSISEISRVGDVATQALSAAWALAGQASERHEIMELHDLTPFNAECPEVAT
ncbi:MAG TPA: hypothetical protein VK709_04120 [Candidatus Saccharimonadales bacterium]|jgi:DNA-binding NtrC family response regulator|nr:hypothetical protein [Candidatus Saccharimonadales bacterium]